jgi:hypothetical protein
MPLDQRCIFRISDEERASLDQAAKELGVKPSVAMRLFLRDGLQAFDKKHQDLLARMDSLQAQILQSQAVLEAIANQADGAYLMSASAVGLVAALDLPHIVEKTQDEVIARIRNGMRLATKLGSELKAAHAAGKSI